ncbi:NTE family protein [Massilia sp. UYP11]|uniref:patatin-like phospholipase family protein n=1 Tax=Massilia sp. UYP11 TaxID=1756385 RepID=UPI003D1908EA
MKSSIFLPIFTLVVLAGCASKSESFVRNEPLCQSGTKPVVLILAPGNIQKACRDKIDGTGVDLPFPNQNVPRARQVFSSEDSDIPATFVGVSISGGGSRAAVFGMAVLERLDQLGILKHVSAISTTSGGGLAGAYYALKGSDINWSHAHDLMAADYLAPWLKRNIGFGSLVSTSVTNKNRSDVMAEVFDTHVFGGRTYGDLGTFIPGSAPIWLANATELGFSKRFTFGVADFNQINSDLKKVPISRAVMTSAAFPGVFNTLALKNYFSSSVAPGFQLEGGVRYTHLIDGGPTDNLGIESLLKLAGTHRAFRASDLNRDEKIERQGDCLLIVVDAYARGVPTRYLSKSDLRGVTGHLVDLNFFDAINAMLGVRRNDLLGYLGLDDGGSFGLRGNQFVYFDAPVLSQKIQAARRVQPQAAIHPNYYAVDLPSKIAAAEEIPRYQMRCAVWHINLGGLEALPVFEQPITAEELPKRIKPDDTLAFQRGLHDALVSQIGTSFRLEGPKKCSADFLRSALHKAADALVLEDYASRHSVCSWMQMHGLDVSDKCGRYVTPHLWTSQLTSTVEFVGPRTSLGLETNEVNCR